MKKNLTTKLHYIMRLLLAFLISYLSVGQINAETVQNPRINLEIKNGTVKEVLEEIESKTDYYFFYNARLVNVDRKVSISANGVDVFSVLDEIFKGTDIDYSVIDNHIVLSPKNLDKDLQQDQNPAKGKVVDAAGLPVIGASVIVKGTQTGGVTDVDGNFIVENVEKGMILQISSIGYKTNEVKWEGNPLRILLEDDIESLNEIVVVGYGTQRKGNIATSVTTIKSENFQDRPAQTIGEALQGQVPGLNVTSKGAPGESPSLQLRGSSVLDASNSSEPLILVDGVPADFNFLNPEDIESVNVLKDAASAAIYGSRASNGVLLVTTKRGKEGKPVFHYNGSMNVNTPMHMPESVSSAQYAQIMNEAAANMNSDPVYSEEEIAAYARGDDPNRYPNTDWLKLAIKNSESTRHQFDVSGGTEVVKYLVSAGFDHETGIFPRTRQNVFNVRSSTDVAVNKKLDFSFDMRYQLRDLKALLDQEDIYKQLISADPTMVAYYTDGTYGYNAGFFTNPLVSLYEGGQRYTKRHEASGLFKINYEIIKGLVFTGIANVKFNFKDEEARSKKLTYKNYFTQEVFEKGQNSFSDRRDKSAYYNLQALLNYKRNFSSHHLDILAGYQQENESSDWLSGSRSGYPTDLVWELNPGPKDNWSNDGNGEHWALASFIGRINYDYDNKYIISMSVRSDGSSRFAKGSRWSTFPSIAAAWRLTQEPFMKGTRDVLDDLKLRVSWGQTGNANGLGLYPSYTLVATGGLILNNTYQQIAYLKTIGNEDLTWEHSDMFNVGIDAQLLKNRLSFTGEYYIKDTKDILLALPVPLEYGFGNPNSNIGHVRNKGWELSIGWKDKIGDFGYGISANLSDNDNEVKDLGGTGPWKGSTTYTDVGLPFNSIYGYESMGLFQSDEEVANAPFQNSKTAAGDIRYKDQNNDNKIDANDRVVLGDPYPHYIFGMNLTFDYKNFDLGIYFNGIGKEDRIVKDNFVRPLNDATIFKHELDYWSPDNTDAKYPRILNKSDASHNYENSDFWMINAGYLRLKNLTFGYTIPSKLLTHAGLSRVRVYFAAKNLLTISDFVPGMDPEASSALSYPFARTYSFGLNIQF